jgi:hypothetical protein
MGTVTVLMGGMNVEVRVAVETTVWIESAVLVVVATEVKTLLMIDVVVS